MKGKIKINIEGEKIQAKIEKNDTEIEINLDINDLKPLFNKIAEFLKKKAGK